MNRIVREKIRYLRQQNKEFGPVMTEVPREHWDAACWDSTNRVRVYRSNRYLAQIFAEEHGAIRISICRTEVDERGEWRQGISWDELHMIKRECGFGDCWAVEVFPSDASLVNVANMRHLFVLPSAPVYAWKRTEVTRG